MPASGFNIGRDTTVVILHPMAPGGRLTVPLQESFDAKQMTAHVESKGLDGVNRFADVPSGWSGTLNFDRSDNSVDAFFDAIEAAFYNGQSLPTGTITEYQTEANGSQTTFVYSLVSFAYTNNGNRVGDQIVKGSIGWKASRRKMQ